MVATTSSPTSWAEDLQTYRPARGSQSYASVGGKSEAPKRFARTDLCPFGSTTDPRYAFDDNPHINGRKGDPTILQSRTEKHGWGDSGYLKEDSSTGPSNRPASKDKNFGRATCALSEQYRGQLQGVLQQTDQGIPDMWMGNKLIDPTKGRRAAGTPQDPKGRRDLFDVIHARNPGAPADDAWLGHRLIDPARGKGCPPGPEELRGRTDLTHVMGQTVMRDPERARLLEKGADPLSDAWCGHKMIDPNKGRLPNTNCLAADNTMKAAFFKDPIAPDHSDWPKEGKLPIDNRASGTVVQQILTGVGKDAEQRLHKPLHIPVPQKFDGRTDLYSNMTYKPLSEGESGKLGSVWDDAGVRRRKPVSTPGSVHPTKGPGLLTWQPEARAASYIPYGKLMQEQARMGHSLEKVHTAETLGQTSTGRRSR